MTEALIREQLEWLEGLPELSVPQQEWCAWARKRIARTEAPEPQPEAEAPPEPTEPEAPPLDINEWAQEQADVWREGKCDEELGAEHFIPWMVLWLWMATDDCSKISAAIRHARPCRIGRSYHLLRDVRQIASNGITNGIFWIGSRGLNVDWMAMEDPERQGLSLILDLMTLKGTLTRKDDSEYAGKGDRFTYALSRFAGIEEPEIKLAN